MARQPSPGQTWREARGDVRIHLDEGDKLVRPRSGEVWPQAACGISWPPEKQFLRMSADPYAVSCGHCKLNFRWRRHLRYLGDDTAPLFVCLDGIMEAGGRCAVSAATAQLMERLLAEGVWVAALFAEPEREMAHLRRARECVAAFGVPFVAACVGQRDLRPLRGTQLLLPRRGADA